MAVDKLIPTTPPADTSMAYFAGQVQEEIAALWAGVLTHLTVTAGTNALTAAASPTLTAYATGLNYVFVAPATNTTGMTINIDSLGNRAITKPDGSALAAGDVVANTHYIISYSASVNGFVLLSGIGSGVSLPTATQQWQVLQADAGLNWVPSQEIFSGNF